MATPDNNPSSALSRRFDLLRQQAGQQAQANKQQAQEGLMRRAASRGRLGSGVYEKLGQEAEQKIEEQKNINLENIEGQRLAALTPIEEAQRQREFQAQQADLQRQFGKAEREAGQAFASKESALARALQQQQFTEQMGFSREQAKAAQEQFRQQFGESQRQFDLNANWQRELSNLQDRQWTKNFDLATQQFELDKDISEFNKQMARDQANKPGFLGGMMNDLFGALGMKNPFSGGGFGGGFGGVLGSSVLGVDPITGGLLSRGGGGGGSFGGLF